MLYESEHLVEPHLRSHGSGMRRVMLQEAAFIAGKLEEVVLLTYVLHRLPVDCAVISN